jgi:hypothetical protein
MGFNVSTWSRITSPVLTNCGTNTLVRYTFGVLKLLFACGRVGGAVSVSFNSNTSGKTTLTSRPSRNSTARRTRANRRRATRVESSVGDLGLLECMGVHQAAVAAFGGEKLERLPFNSHLLQLQLGTEAVIGKRDGPDVLEAGMGYAAHLALAWGIFRAHQAVILPLRDSQCLA